MRYSIILIVVSLAFSFTFFTYGIRQTREKTLQDMSLICANLSSQLDVEVRPAEFAMVFFLSNIEMVLAVQSLGAPQRVPGQDSTRVTLAKREIQSLLYSYFIDTSYYRFNYFNPAGDFITNDFRGRTIADGDFNSAEVSWLSRLDNTLGEMCIIPPHVDAWDIEEPQQVFSVVRKIQGNENLGYMEVQQQASRLEEIFALEGLTDLYCLVANTEGDVLYSPLDAAETQRYIDMAIPHEAPTNDTPTETISTKGELIVRSYSAYTGYYVLLVQGSQALTASIGSIAFITLAVSLTVTLLSMLFISITARRLTDPIRQLKEQLDNTSLDTLDASIQLSVDNDEIENFQLAYARLIERLQDSIEKETRLSAMNLLAHFDSLQAQVNPHFLFNILNVISYRGVFHDDEELCAICDSLAAMLRYSTDTSRRYATLAEELEHLRYYVYLMKTRYGALLECNISVEASLMMETIPKITLQQLVENAINHGYTNRSGSMRISITGYRQDDGWRICITDDGDGFDPDILRKLQAKMAEQKEAVLQSQAPAGMAIGGMGLLNTYLRLLMLFGNKLYFSMDNLEQGGSVVAFGLEVD